MGNEHYNKGEYLKAYEEYEVGMKYAKSNVILMSNMAACYLGLERWEQCIQICNQSLEFSQITPRLSSNVRTRVRRWLIYCLVYS